jgi:metal-sulfur cluster biosynthetic enzyme
MNDHPFPYDGPEALREPVQQALRSVIDPELALSIVDLGLVYGVTITPANALVLWTMTSAACPVVDVIVDDISQALDAVLPADLPLELKLVWEPVWTPDRLTPQARAFLGQ